METNKLLNPNEYTDNTVLQFGKHKGKRLIDVPSLYLKYLWDTDTCFGAMKDYIRDNLDVITKNAKAEWDAKDNTTIIPRNTLDRDI
jgi:uncharacterized protein (DUF3820 family)